MAKKSILDIIINVVKKGDGDSAVIKGLGQIKGTVAQAGMVFAALAGAYYAVDKIVKQSVGDFSTLADEVRNFSNATGLSATESSKLIQVTDDLFISSESLMRAIQKGAKNFDYSIAGLSKMSDEYLALTSAQDQAKYAQDRFGKSWVEFVPLLQSGGDAIKAMADAQSGALILDERALAVQMALKQSEDNLADSKLALSVALGQALTPALTDLNNALAVSLNGWQQYFIFLKNDSAIKDIANQMSDAANAAKKPLVQGRGAGRQSSTASDFMAAATEEYFKQTKAVVENTVALDENAIAERQAADEARALAAALSGDLANAIDSHDEKLVGLQEEYGNLQTKLAELVAGGVLQNEQEEFDATTAAIQENEQAQKDLAAATQQAINKIIYQKVAMKLGTTDALKFARSLGLISESDYALQTGIDMLTEKYDANADGIVTADENVQGYLDAIIKLKNSILTLPAETVVDVIVNYISAGTPPPNPPPKPPPWTCFAAGTMIAVPAGERAIETIGVGDEVISQDGGGQEIVTRVAQVFRHEAADGYHIINRRICATGNHLLFVNGGWMQVQDIELGDMLTRRHGKRERVADIELRVEGVQVYNLEIEHECHNYFADGVLVHNKEMMMAEGGVVNGAQLRLIGEAGPEAVIPLKGGAVPVQFTGNGSGAGVSFSGANFYVTISSGASIGEFMQVMMDAAGV